MTGSSSTDVTRDALAGLLGVPPDQVGHYAVVLRGRRGELWQRFCGMPADAIKMHASAAFWLAENQADVAAEKLAAGCTACGDEAAGL